MNTTYRTHKKIQIAKGIIPAVIGLAVGAVSLWKTAAGIGEDKVLSRIDFDSDHFKDEPFVKYDDDGIIREYRSERIGD